MVTPRTSPPVSAGPMAGPMGSVPPPWLPLGFLLAAGVGLAGLGLALVLAGDSVVASPFHPETTGTVHLAMLAFLTTAVLGALHQFSPVVGQRPLRSVRAGVVTLIGMVLTAWLLPYGFVFGPEAIVATAAVIGTCTVLLAAWNLSGPLMSRTGGVPVVGLRLSVTFLVTTVLFGVVYAFDRQAGWFVIFPHRLLAHAHIGLIGWLGLTYVAVAEKLWPMFLLSHRPSARSGAVAVGAIATGVVPLAVGLLYGWGPVAWIGATLVVIGFGAHIVSLASSVKHRKRKLEILHGYLAASTVFLLAAVGFAIASQIGGIDSTLRIRLVEAEVASLAAWIALAILGHVHKIVPFIVYSMVRSRGIKKHPSGRPLLFGDLYSKRWATVVLVVAVTSLVALVSGLVFDVSAFALIAGIGLFACAVSVTGNLVLGARKGFRLPPDQPRATSSSAIRSMKGSS